VNVAAEVVGDKIVESGSVIATNIAKDRIFSKDLILDSKIFHLLSLVAELSAADMKSQPTILWRATKVASFGACSCFSMGSMEIYQQRFNCIIEVCSGTPCLHFSASPSTARDSTKTSARRLRRWRNASVVSTMISLTALGRTLATKGLHLQLRRPTSSSCARGAAFSPFHSAADRIAQQSASLDSYISRRAVTVPGRKPACSSFVASRHPVDTNKRHLVRLLSTNHDGGDGQLDDAESTAKSDRRNRRRTRRTYSLVDDASIDHSEKLAAAFDTIARAEGFDQSTARFSDSASFDDPDDDEEFMDDDDGIDDFELDDGDDGSKEYLDFGSENDSMSARLANAKKDMDLGRISVPAEMDDFANKLTREQLQKLGFKAEKNPYGNDEISRPRPYQLVKDAMVCPACGSDFQSHNPRQPGFLPPEKFEVQTKLSKIEKLQELQRKSESTEWTPEDEIEWLIQTSSGQIVQPDDDPFKTVDIEGACAELGLDLEVLSAKSTICQRCHGLQNFGKVDESLRPGWTDEPLLSQQGFRDLLAPIRSKPAVIIALVDVFDFAGSVLPELDSIAGDNPVIVAANKVDLLHSKMGPQRVENWVRRELEHLGIQSLANIGGAVRLVSCKTGLGVAAMLAKARDLAEEKDCDLYVVGAANAGKSSLINYILDRNSRSKDADRVKRRAGNANAIKGGVTTSPLPGTTLKFIRIDLGGGRSLYDTPGLLVPGTLTQLLTPEELKMVVPKK
jgi:50S ribosome-binding GTPase